jgi:hypothetical protein
MLCSLYLRNGTAYVPTDAETDEGIYFEIEPVGVADVADGPALQKVIREALSRGNPKIPTPTRDNIRTPVVLKYAKVKSWSVFERNCMSWSIEERGDSYHIETDRRRSDRGFEIDPAAPVITLPRSTSLDEVARQAAVLMQLAFSQSQKKTAN